MINFNFPIINVFDTILSLKKLGYDYYRYKDILFIISKSKPIELGCGYFSGDRLCYLFGDKVIKILNRPNNRIYDALKVNFYKQISNHLIGLIMDDENNCFGYISYKCERRPVGNSHIRLIEELLISKLNTGYYFTDLKDANIMFYKNEPTLIDLDSVSLVDSNDDIDPYCPQYITAMTAMREKNRERKR